MSEVSIRDAKQADKLLAALSRNPRLRLYIDAFTFAVGPAEITL
jgi:hypothetical protein